MASIIGPLVGQSDYHVKNTKEFVTYIRQQQIEEVEIMVSFDVKSLFTNVPVYEAHTIIGRKLEEDEYFEDRVSEGLTRTDVMLLELCLRSTNFVFQGEFYQQKDGAAMGSRLTNYRQPLHGVLWTASYLRSPTPPRKWKR